MTTGDGAHLAEPHLRETDAVAVAGRLRVAPIAAVPLVAAAGMFVLAAQFSVVWPQLVGSACVGLVITSLLSALRPVRFQARLDAPPQVSVGAEFVTTLRLANRGGAVRAIVVRQRWFVKRAAVAPVSALVEVVASRASLDIPITRVAKARGVVERGEISIDVAAPLGFFARRAVVPMSVRIAVVPALVDGVDLGPISGRPTGLAGGHAGTEFHGVREWRSGDAMRDVEWRATARTGRLTVLEREGDGRGCVVVVMVGGGRPDDERAFAVAASTAAQALHHGSRACVLAQPANGRSGRVRPPFFVEVAEESQLLEAFARVAVAQTPDAAALDTAIAHAAGGGVVLLAGGSAARGATAQWRSQVFDAAALVGARVVELAAVV